MNTIAEPRQIFVFGSNEDGRHGKGAALHAFQNFGAKRGVGVGLTGNAYAIPTKNGKLESLPLDTIAKYVVDFLQFARKHPEWRFLVTAVGTGLAGYKHEQIGPMFAVAPDNCFLPEEWMRFRVPYLIKQMEELKAQYGVLIKEVAMWRFLFPNCHYDPKSDFIVNSRPPPIREGYMK